MTNIKTLYHGSNAEIKTPDLNHYRLGTDFGSGFYCLENKSVAELWASNKNDSIVNVYEVDLSNLNIYTFDLSEEWLDFVVWNRNQTSEPTSYDKYDVIIGPVVDDQAFGTVLDYEDGLLALDEIIETLNCGDINIQYCFKSEKAIKQLNFKESYILNEYEKNTIRQDAKYERELLSEAIRKVRKRRRPRSAPDSHWRHWESTYIFKFGMIFEKCATIKHFNLFSFIDCFTKSQVLQELNNFNETIMSQGELYIIDLLLEEYPELASQTGYEYEYDLAQWLGLLYGHMIIQNLPTDTIRRIDWEYIYENNYEFYMFESGPSMIELIEQRQLYKK